MAKRVIVVTDGDNRALQALTVACQQVGAYLITESAGNPTPLTGEDMMFLIKCAPRDPVVVMVDDHGAAGRGPGEEIIGHLLRNRDEVEILGVVAVASNAPRAAGLPVTRSITNGGQVFCGPVDKNGRPESPASAYLEGDTSEHLFLLSDIPIIGCGDPGKMEDKDLPEVGSPITTRCLRALLRQENTRKQGGDKDEG